MLSFWKFGNCLSDELLLLKDDSLLLKESLLSFGKSGNCLSDELLLLKDDSLSLKESLLSQNGEFVVNKGPFVILTQKY